MYGFIPSKPVLIDRCDYYRTHNSLIFATAIDFIDDTDQTDILLVFIEIDVAVEFDGFLEIVG